MPTHLPVFLLTTWLLAMLPGAGQALMVRQTLQGGPRLARSCIAGVATGLLIWSVAAGAGLSAVMLADPAAYAAVRIGGGAVLVGLGISTLRSLREPAADAPTGDPGMPGESGVPRRGSDFRSGYFAGLATNLGNPKAGVFAISILPQFVTPHGPVLLSTIALGATWSFVTVCWYLLFTWAVGRGRRLVSKPAIQRYLQITTGSVLLLLGLVVAFGV